MGRNAGIENEEARRGGAPDRVSKSLNDLCIPDYVMRAFCPSDDSRNGSARRHSATEVPGEDLVPRRE